MFIRTVDTKSGGKTHRYLRVVENYRDNGKIKQRVLWNLGNLDKIRHKLPGLLKSLGNHSGERLVSLKGLRAEAAKEYGNILLLRSVWNRLGIGGILDRNKTAERMRPYLMTATFYHLLNPSGRPPLTEWLDRVYIPELTGTSRPGKVRLTKRFFGLLEYLGRNDKGRGLCIVSKTSRIGSVDFCYITRLRMNALGVHSKPLRRKEPLLAILARGGVPWAYGVYDGKIPLAFVQDMLADNRLGQNPRKKKTTFVTRGQTIGNGVTNFFNREGIPYTAFVSTRDKRGTKRPVYGIGRGYVAHGVKTNGKKGPWVYVFSKKSLIKKATHSLGKGPVEFAIKTNMAKRAFLTKAIKARRELIRQEGFFGDITVPAGVLSKANYKKGYVLVCLLTYLLLRDLDRGLSRARAGRRFTPLGLLDKLKDVKLITNVVSGRRLNCVTKIPRQTRELFRAFDVKIPRASLHIRDDGGVPQPV